MKKSLFIPIQLLLSFTLLAQEYPTESVLNQGDFYKLEIEESGMYKITASMLSEMGVNVGSVNPQNIKIYGNGGRMLPQANNAFRYLDLEENAIQVVGEADGNFDGDDYILFYAEGAYLTTYDESLEVFRQEVNVYADKNYYFLNIADTQGRRVENVSGGTSISNPITTYPDFIHHELEERNILGSGRVWFGENYNFLTEDEFTFNVEGIVPNTEIRTGISVFSNASDSSKFSFDLNGSILGEIAIRPTAQTTYGIKGRLANRSFSVNSDDLSNTSELALSLAYTRPNNSANGFLNFFSINFQRALRLYGEQTTFRYITDEENLSFQVGSMAEENQIWNVTDALHPKTIDFQLSGSNASFSANNSSFSQFVAFQSQDLPQPTFIEKVQNQNLHGLATPDFVIITPKKFAQEAQRLADFRENNDGLATEVVLLSEIYNEFSSGKQDVVAIRDFLRMLYLKSNQLKYALLFGDGSYDYKDRLDNNTNYVPIYTSRESYHPIFSYSSDDFYGFMEGDEGEWQESLSSSNHDLDIAIGRFPVETEADAKVIVDKLIRYSQNRESLGKWRKKVVFVADDGDGNTHQAQADALGVQVESNYSNFNVDRLFIDAFPQVSTPFGKQSFTVKEKINQDIQEGVLIMNFSGHGSETGWTQESILDNPQILNWTNEDNMPLFVTATCEFGRYDNPAIKSGAEYAVLHDRGGAIGLLTTTRPVFSSTNFQLNQAFYDVVFEPINGEMPRIGDVLIKTKNASNTGVVNRNFSLLGDPSMRLAYPEDQIKITHINNQPTNESQVDSLSVLEPVQVSGVIQNGNSIDNSFDGVVDITVFDRPSEIQTLGDDGANTVMTFNNRERIIYKGKATVRQGAFDFSFVVPKDISYNLDFGKISLYAQHSTEARDASGVKDNILIGLSNPSLPVDNTPPTMSVFLGDESFVSGDVVPTNTTLIVNLEDENGINILGNSIGHDITAILDGDTENEIILNEYYTTEIDQFNKGKVLYPLNDLEEGLHTLLVRAWDTHNNSVSQEITFSVVQQPLNIESLTSFPNPFSESTTVSFRHNRPNEDLEAELTIFSSTGQLIFKTTQVFRNTNSTLDFTPFHRRNSGGEITKNGLYIYQLKLRSFTTNEVSVAQSKFIIQD